MVRDDTSGKPAPPLQVRLIAPIALFAIIALLLTLTPDAPSDLREFARLEPLPFRSVPARVGRDAASLLCERGMDAYVHGDYTVAAELLEGAISADAPGLANLRLYLGISHLLAGRPVAARRELGHAVASDLASVSGEARWYLAQCALMLNDSQVAQQLLSDLAETGSTRSMAAAEQLESLD